MANEHIPNDPYRGGLGGSLGDENLGRPQRFNEDLQIDPQLQEGPASTSKVALFAVGIAIVLGAVFYGLNNTSVKDAQTTPTAQTAQQSPQPAPPGMRDVTPGQNTQPGMTTGAAPSRPTPPQAAPQGTEIDRSATSPSSSDNK
jgi:hypothetical protein